MRAALNRLAGALALWLVLVASAGADCAPVDYLRIALPAPGDRVKQALELAYPGARLDRAAGVFVTAGGERVPALPLREVGPRARLDGATIGDQFAYLYPLAFDLAPRRTPWQDPGRVRNDAMFRALYFDSAGAVRGSLVTVRYRGKRQSASFQVTRKHCVHVQLQAALSEIARASPAFDRFFARTGGSFNWRRIAGTSRLSVHSFGIAVDLNTELGGYWRWSGAAEGQAFDYDNRIPAQIVAAFERRGFIWGGKWHHFDGMHFEYRPELILYARLAGR